MIFQISDYFHNELRGQIIVTSRRTAPMTLLYKADYALSLVSQSKPYRYRNHKNRTGFDLPSNKLARTLLALAPGDIYIEYGPSPEDDELAFTARGWRVALGFIRFANVIDYRTMPTLDGPAYDYFS